MQKQKLISYNEAESLLREGDVLLFRSKGFLSCLIKRLGQGRYSHVGVAAAVGENGHTVWMCIEFAYPRAQSVSLEQYVNQGIVIDIYRPVSSRKITIWKDDKLEEIEIKFSGKSVTNIMRRMTGLRYGWQRLLWFLQYKSPFLRLFYNMSNLIDDEDKPLIFPVCSTSVSHAFYKIGFDLLHNKSNDSMEPSDVARSPLLNYLFTLKK